MELREEVAQIKQHGMEQAATLWETLETLPEPIDPINIYKAACSAKCAEFMMRIRNNPVAVVLMGTLMKFLDETMKITGGQKGSKEEGMRVVTEIERAMPLTQEIFDDAVAYATRQHAYDGIIMLSAAKMGKETETKEAIDRFQASVAKAMLMAIFRGGLEDIEETNARIDEKFDALEEDE
jgi:hypothetical protein